MNKGDRISSEPTESKQKARRKATSINTPPKRGFSYQNSVITSLGEKQLRKIDVFRDILDSTKFDLTINTGCDNVFSNLADGAGEYIATKRRRNLMNGTWHDPPRQRGTQVGYSQSTTGAGAPPGYDK